jgi:hypothetical protein
VSSFGTRRGPPRPRPCAFNVQLNCTAQYEFSGSIPATLRYTSGQQRQQGRRRSASRRSSLRARILVFTTGTRRMSPASLRPPLPAVTDWGRSLTHSLITQLLQGRPDRWALPHLRPAGPSGTSAASCSEASPNGISVQLAGQ